MDGEDVRLPLAAVQEIASRLSQMEGYRLPAQLENEREVTQTQKETYFKNLLMRDPGADPRWFCQVPGLGSPSDHVRRCWEHKVHRCPCDAHFSVVVMAGLKALIAGGGRKAVLVFTVLCSCSSLDQHANSV
jgi:hypothetical protein